jgi:hypothetical protein
MLSRPGPDGSAFLRTLLHLAPLQLFAYPIYVQHNSRKKQQLILKIQSHADIEAFCNHQI